MNTAQKFMLAAIAKKMIAEGTPITILNWTVSPDVDGFLTVLKPSQTIVDKVEYEFLLDFYNENKKL